MYKRYAELRDAAGVSDYEISKETGIPQSTLSEWKSGKYKPKADKLLKIARYFGIPLEELVEGEDHEARPDVG